MEKTVDQIAVGSGSPWGPIQTVSTLIPGLVAVTTASHGGVHASAVLNERVPAQWRRDDGWYEEDCEWAIILWYCRQHLRQQCRDECTLAVLRPREPGDSIAEATIKHYYPDIYASIMVTIP